MLPRSPVYEESGIYGKHTPFCPHCGRLLIIYDYRSKAYVPDVWRGFCPGCGQKIKWGIVGFKTRLGFRKTRTLIDDT